MSSKMRETLEYAVKQLCNATESNVYGDDVVYLVGCMRTVANKCKEALSAPLRNCDRFADSLDAQIGFLNEVWQVYVTKETMRERDEFENWTDEMKSIYAKWLLKEAKGGAE